MSAPQSPVERDARRYAARDLRITRRYRRDSIDALELLHDVADSLAREAAVMLLAGSIPEARRYARAHQLVAESGSRLRARHQRAYDAERAREAAKHGIKAGEAVRVTRAGVGTTVPTGTVCTVERVSGELLHTTIDGVTCIVWASDVERVEPDDDGTEAEALAEAEAPVGGAVA